MASIVRPVANRAVHLRLMPRPSNLGESREVLRLISQFGEVEYMRNLKYEALAAPNTMLVIFKEEEAAKYCIQKSPIRFRMGRAAPEEPAPENDMVVPQLESGEQYKPFAPSEAAPSPSYTARGDSFDSSQMQSMSTSALPQPPHRPTQTPFEPPPPKILDSRIFQISANPCRANFRDQINIGSYHGPFILSSKSTGQSDLVRRVPYAGLSYIDWRKSEKKWKIVASEKAREHEGPQRRKSLRELYDEGPSEGAAPSSGEALPS